MKKYLSLIGVCIAGGIGLNINLQYSSAEGDESGVTLDNIEALAQTEGSGKQCLYLGSLDCPHFTIKVLYIQ